MIDYIMYQLRIRSDYKNYVKMALLSIAMLLLLYILNWLPIVQQPLSISSGGVSSSVTCKTRDPAHLRRANSYLYKFRYPLTNPRKVTNGVSYKVAIIADLDEERSKVPDKKMTWQSYLRYGHLVKYKDGTYAFDLDEKITMTSKLSEKGRGFELSELCAYNGKLYTVDDRTGIVYQIYNNKPIPWVILQDGDGMDTKGFKGEWMTVKDDALYIGGLGKEWTTRDGNFVNYHPLFVKTVSPNGAVFHHNWTDNYLKIRAKAGVHFPGYMIHEAVMWSPVKRRWYFLPRRMSTIKYNDEEDERHGTNVMISCDADFNDITLVHIGNLDPTHGFSSLKFVPGTGDDVAVALKSREVDGDISSFIMIFEVNTGRVLMPEKRIENQKYEGVEFV